MRCDLVAGLPVAVALYTAVVPMLVYAPVDTSRMLSVSSTTKLAMLAGTQLGLAIPDGDSGKLATAAALSALTGAILMLAAALPLGFVANFISTPVLIGFEAGIGLVIVLDQLPKLLGIDIAKQGFFRDILTVLRHLHDTSPATIAVTVVTLGLLASLNPSVLDYVRAVKQVLALPLRASLLCLRLSAVTGAFRFSGLFEPES
jgi:MFS superfamily sulfate permease-like transporter